MQVNMTVNGEQVTADVEPRMLLVHFLRDQLRLTGTHWDVTPATAEHAWSRSTACP